MSSISLQLAFDLQKRLDEAEIPSVVTGVWALNYHGVDIAMHDFELCVPSTDIDRAARALQAYSDSYHRLQDCEFPDFYRPYRRGAKQFQMVGFQPPLLLLLVSDSMLSMDISANMTERGLTLKKAHNELQEYCHGTSADVLCLVAWPSLAAFMAGWLDLSIKAAGAPQQIVYLMYAERMIDASVIDAMWCDMNLKDERIAEIAKEILAGKEKRLVQDLWL